MVGVFRMRLAGSNPQDRQFCGFAMALALPERRLPLANVEFGGHVEQHHADPAVAACPRLVPSHLHGGVVVRHDDVDRESGLCLPASDGGEACPVEGLAELGGERLANNDAHDPAPPEASTDFVRVHGCGNHGFLDPVAALCGSFDESGLRVVVRGDEFRQHGALVGGIAPPTPRCDRRHHRVWGVPQLSGS